VDNVVLSEWQAALVWDVLVECCGVSEDPEGDNRHEFFYHSTGDGISEWRFVGSLGMGGKLHALRGLPRPDGGRGEPRLRVDCNLQDLTPEREAAVQAANARLETLAKELKDVPTGPRSRLSSFGR
jgi:hypothetical protein